MARARSGGGSNGSILGLVFFGAGFFICMILAIVFYTKVESAQQDAERAQSELASTINSADQNDSDFIAVTAEGSGTTVGRLLQAFKASRAEVNTLQRNVASTTTSLDDVTAQLATQTQATQKAQSDLNQQIDAKLRQAEELTARVNALESTVQDISAENTRLKSQIDDSIENVTATYLAQIEEWKRRTNDAQQLASESGRTIVNLQETIDELRGKTPDDVPVTLADAKVVAQIEEENKVYLNIGREANLSLGLAFQVYDADDLVKIEDPESEGKAIVEIINIESDSAIGRVVQRKPRAVVNNGDVLVNVIYDPNRIFSFHVFGQFDLNADGDLDENGTALVRSLVTRSGGQLTDSLSFATDYLVLGEEPILPDQPEDELDLIKMREFRVGLENFQAYQALLEQARALGVPVLNQNRFLDLVGYYQR
ncbi:MAG: hypothetical protein AAGH99_00660 [Planctomycetota bacterium]